MYILSMSELVELNAKLAAAAKGDRAAFGEVYDGFVKKIYDYAFFRVKDRQRAEDIVADTFMKALEHVHTYDESKGAATAWLYRIARNTLVDQYRNAKKTTQFPEDFDIADRSDLKAHIENKDMLQKIEQALGKLSDKEQEIITLRIWDELSYKEIAEILGKSEASLKMAASRALRSLRKELPLGVYLGLLLVISSKL